MFLKSFELPFFGSYFEEIPDDNDHIFYSKFSVDLNFDKETGLIYQELTDEKLKSLDDIYKQGSTWLDSFVKLEYREGEHRKNRKKEFLKIFFSFFNEDAIDGLDILEVGCGEGHILNELKERGANVIGCDPGPFSEYAKKKYGIEILNSFFSDKIFNNNNFDIIFSFSFLTFVNYPLKILSQMRKILKENGRILTAVADHTHHIEMGNIFCLSPTMINYFTQNSIKNIYHKAGLSDVTVRLTTYGYGLHIIGVKSSQKENDVFDFAVERLNSQALEFIRKSNAYLRKLQEKVDNFKGKSIGLMGGNVETTNLMNLINFRDIKVTIYEYDDNFVDKYLPSVKIPISHDNELPQDNVDEIWIVPIAFAEKIEKKIRYEFKLNTPICNLRTFLESIK